MGAMGLDRRLVVAAVMAFSLSAFAAEAPPAKKASAAKTPAKAKLEVPKIDLSGLGEIPKGEGMQSRKAETADLAPQFGDSETVKYDVVGIGHAKSFTRSAKGLMPVGGMLRSIALEGKPPTTQAFSTVVRVRSSRVGDASIEIVVLDPSGDTALSGSGLLRFKSAGSNTDWVIDWEPTPRPKSGTYQVLVRVAGRPMGTWPLEVVVANP